jgi:hypothetical protein
MLYTAPLNVASSTAIRAIAVSEGYLPSRVATHTYLFRQSVIGSVGDVPPTDAQHIPQYYPSLPVAWHHGYPRGDYDVDPAVVLAHRGRQTIPGTSPALTDDGMFVPPSSIPMVLITVPVDDFFMLDSGIYNHLSIDPSDIDREVPASFEWIPQGASAAAVSQTCRLSLDSHRLELHFGHDAGGGGSLKTPVFDVSQTTRSHFDVLLLRRPGRSPSDDLLQSSVQGGGPRTGTFCRDPWMCATQRSLGGRSRAIRFVHVFINGLYWGAHHLTEPVDRDFLSNYFGTGGDAENFQAFHSIGEPTTRSPNKMTQGELDEIKQVIESAQALQPGQDDDPLWDNVRTFRDVDQFIDYVLLMTFAGDGNWDDSLRFGRRRLKRDQQGTLLPGDYALRFFVWDPEAAFDDNIYFPLGEAEQEPPPVVRELLSRLLACPLAREKFRQRAHAVIDLAGAPLTESLIVQRWADVTLQNFRRVMWPEAARWGFSRPVDSADVLTRWNSARTNINAWFENRLSTYRNNLLASDLITP